MTLSKQLLFLIALMFLLIFSINLAISINSIRGYLEIEAKIHAQDTATSLGLSLSPHIMDETDPILETMMRAIFDRGFYQEIKLLNVEQQPLVTLTNEHKFAQVPDWFIALLPMKTATASTEISYGWSIGGTLFVTVNPSYGYLRLYEQAYNAFNYSLLTFFMALGLLFVLLRMILKPLKKIEHQASNIANGNFTQLLELPWTTEIKHVGIAMNSMSAKLSGIINNLNSELLQINQQLQHDVLTDLPQKTSFLDELKSQCSNNQSGHAFYLKLDKLSLLSERHDPAKIDALLLNLADFLRNIDIESGQSHAYRFYGSEFALLLNNSNQSYIEHIAKRIRSFFVQLGAKYSMDDIAHIGISPYNSSCTNGQVLDKCLEAYQQACLIGTNSYAFSDRNSIPISMDAWKQRTENIISQKDFRIHYINQAKTTQLPETVVMTEAFIEVNDQQGNKIPTSTFIATTEKIARTVELDCSVIENVVAQLQKQPTKHAITINLSIQSIADKQFLHWLKNLLIKQAALANFLTFSLSAYAVNKDIESFKQFIKIVHEGDAKILLKRYESQLLSLDTLNQYQLDYLRLAQHLTDDMHAQVDKYKFIETLKSLCDLLEIKVLAEKVVDDADLESLKTLGIFAASR